MTAADQPTTEPSEVRDAIIGTLDEQGAFCGTCDRQPGDPVEDCKDCTEVLGKYADTLLVVLARVAPLLAPAPQPAADTETDTPNQSTPADPLAPPEIVEQYRLRDRDPKPWTIEMPALDTERDERLRDARALVSVLRRYPGDRQTPAVRALLVLEEEATRLDAVVTAVREVHRYRYLAGDAYPTCDGCGYIADDEDDPCLTRRALDGGAV